MGRAGADVSDLAQVTPRALACVRTSAYTHKQASTRSKQNTQAARSITCCVPTLNSPLARSAWLAHWLSLLPHTHSTSSSCLWCGCARPRERTTPLKHKTHLALGHRVALALQPRHDLALCECEGVCVCVSVSVLGREGRGSARETRGQHTHTTRPSWWRTARA